MRIRSILYILFIASFIGVFFYSNIPSEKIDDDFQSNSIRKSTIQLHPLPIILSKNSGSQNTILYDLLLNKSEKTVVLYDTEVDLGAFGTIFPFDTKHLVLEFKYNAEKGRLEFSGSDLKSRKIYGHCIITNKNNIRYDVVIEHDKYHLEIESVHNPDNENSSAFIGGGFRLRTNMPDALSLITDVKLNVLDDKEIYIRGNFSSKGNLLNLSDIKIQDHKITIDTEIDFSTPSPLFKINVNNPSTNLDDFKSNDFALDNPEIVQDLLESLAKFNFQTSLSTGDIKYKDIGLKNASISINSKNNSEIEVSNLYFEFDDKSSFSTQGTLSNAKFYPHYNGSINLKNVRYENLAKLLDLEVRKFKNKKKINISSDLSLHSSLIILKDLNIYEGKKILEAKRLQYSFVNANRSILTGEVKVDKSIGNSNIVNALIKKYSDTDNGFMEKNVIDLNFALAKSLDQKNVKEVHLNYIYDKSLSIHNIILPNSKTEADIEIDDKSQKFTMSLVSKEVDLNSLHESMQDLLYISNFSDINNRFFSKQGTSLLGISGDISINLQSREDQGLKNLKCNLSYINDQATFSDCYLGTSGGDILLSGKIGKNKKGMYYDISYRGDKVPMSSSILGNVVQESDQGSNGKLDLQGYIASKGANALELSKNMVGSMAVKFFDVKLRNVFDSDKNDLNNSAHKDYILSLIKGNFDFSSDSIKSNNIEYLTESNEKGRLLLERDLVKDSTKIDFMPNQVS